MNKTTFVTYFHKMKQRNRSEKAPYIPNQLIIS